jgi:hypothetical protein
MWLALFSLFLLHALALPPGDTPVRVCSPGMAEPEFDMLLVNAMSYLRVAPASCFGPCPCPPDAAARCAIGFSMVSDGVAQVVALFNSTTVIEARLASDAGEAGNFSMLLDVGAGPAHVTLDLLDARFLECHAERTVSRMSMGCANGTEDMLCTLDPLLGTRMRARCAGEQAYCANPPPVACRRDARLGTPCTRRAGTCVRHGTYICDGADGTVRCSEPKPRLATCESLRFTCGQYAGPCGEVLDCGACAPGQECLFGKCRGLY